MIFFKKGPIKVELTPELNDLFPEGTYHNWTYRSELNELFQEGPLKVELKLELNDPLQKGPIKVELTPE